MIKPRPLIGNTLWVGPCRFDSAHHKRGASPLVTGPTRQNTSVHDNVVRGWVYTLGDKAEGGGHGGQVGDQATQIEVEIGVYISSSISTSAAASDSRASLSPGAALLIASKAVRSFWSSRRCPSRSLRLASSYLPIQPRTHINPGPMVKSRIVTNIKRIGTADMSAWNLRIPVGAAAPQAARDLQSGAFSHLAL